jgi:hypothetical protein
LEPFLGDKKLSMAEELLPAMSVRHANLYGEVAENTPFPGIETPEGVRRAEAFAYGHMNG